ncbi:hypothetical protein K493DRAFT_409222 [Basidiobolus meristosporus CBS 931.73]|uniref:Retinoic acid induced 16-like protein n=1 Tax=Basidiobolus meristosporus CBS 931.73 TaxID=1314790 RepID=A0A1Y1Y1Q0_9FUNG|nr:hypothetical protein K493DRAFT_409222 [Basidiobolus meristosporus CBS 931.73]|eukprot:ORX91646.1 hypothetical protein K493DRAFT_409222 [Basidiobolus meristosporus CBS 931.73]
MVGPKTKPNQALRLTKFQECWKSIQKVLESRGVKSESKVTEPFKTIVDLLVQEEIETEEGTTGVCMEYLLKNNILGELVTLTESDGLIGVRGEVIRLISSMINLLDDRFLVHNAVHAPTLKILNACMNKRDSKECHADDLVDLMYNICSKIHGYPELLHIFFHEKQWLTVPQKSSGGRTQGQNRFFNPDLLRNLVAGDFNSNAGAEEREYEFVFFKHLMGFIHKEGKTGDIARTALLFLMDITNSGLRDFILTGDFCAIIAAGLGAFYSQLPRKLVVDMSTEPTPPAVPSAREAQSNEISSSLEFQTTLESFLKYIDFTQEVLIRCSSGSICNSLLENTKNLFLENILYPSLLECSDVDGSAVAVITYLDILIQSVQNTELNNMIVAYLVNSDLAKLPLVTNQSAKIAADDHSAEVLVPPLLPYNMKDLIFSGLRSTSQPAVIAALKLLKTMLTRHCMYTLNFLDIEFVSQQQEPMARRWCTPVNDHLRVLNRYLSLISLIDPSHEKETSVKGYGQYLLDAGAAMEGHEQYHQDDIAHIQPKNPLAERKAKRHARTMSVRYSDLEVTRSSIDEKPAEVASLFPQCLGTCSLYKHRINSTDPMMHILIGLLSGFFGQSCELNLAVTGVLIAVVSCPSRDLEGWVSSKVESPSPHNSRGSSINPSEQKESKSETPSLIYDDESSDEEIDPSIQEEINQTRLYEDPAFFAVLEELSNQIVRCKRDFPQFDQRFQSRREELLDFSEKPTTKALRSSKENEMNLSANRKSFEEIIDNAIILNEVIKEIVSIIQVRRSLGVDEIWYV